MSRAGVLRLKKSCLPRLCLKTLSSEHVVLSKLLHRAKNQHRHDKSYQRMTGVSRQLKKYLMVNLFAEVNMLIPKLFSINVNARSIPPDKARVIDEMYLKLLDGATFSADLLSFIEDTWREVDLKLVRGHFVPFYTVILASLSRVWYCLRFHLLGIAETYTALKNAVPQAKPPVWHVVSHLKPSHRHYLDIPQLQHLQPVSSESSLSKNGPGNVAIQDTGVAVKLTEEKLQDRMRDFGLPPVRQPLAPAPPPRPADSACDPAMKESLTGAQKRTQKRKRQRKFARECKSSLERSGDANMSQSAPSFSGVSTTRTGSDNGTSRVRQMKKLKLKKKKKKYTCRDKMRGSDASTSQSAPSLPGVSTTRRESDNGTSRVRETKTLKLKKKRKKYKCRDKTESDNGTSRVREMKKLKLEKKRKSYKCRDKKQKASVTVSGGFRWYIVRQSGRQRMIIGRKTWAEKRKKKQPQYKSSPGTRTAVPLQSVSSTYIGPMTSTSGTSPLAGGGMCRGVGDVHHMQRLFQHQLDSAGMADKDVNVSSGVDDIDQIFSNLQ